VPFNIVTYVQQGLLDDAGLSYPRNAAEYKAMLQALTKPQQGVYGTGSENNNVGGASGGGLGYPITMLFRAPNNWAVDSNGKFTRYLGTEEYRAALAFATDLYAAGVYHPNTATYNNVSAKADFSARTFAVRYDGWQPSSLQYWNTGLGLSPPAKIRLLPPFASDGGTPVFYFGSMARSFSMIKQAPPDRVRMMLRILNWLAAPFGSVEYALQYYGIKGVDFTLDERGNPQLTDRGKLDVAVPWQWLTQGPLFDFDPLSAEYAQVMHDAAQAYLPAGINDPSIGLYSATGQAKGGVIDQTATDAFNDIFFGRRPLSDYDQIVKDWRAGGGDQIRSELEDAYQRARS
jgi:putative aldouronate transport system substrate-binding protein